VSAAYNLARQLARSRAESDDLVSEAFARVLDTLRGGRDPDSAFHAYLATSRPSSRRTRCD
jgi:DNA-directed RNA polymerase specialized sigma24 family protein